MSNIEKVNVPVSLNINPMPTKNLISPIRLYLIALKPALTACGRSHQKLISKKEQIPIPSHPT